jgi:hypothetical protein
MRDLRMTLVYFLIFTIISSALAYEIVIKAYDTYDVDNFAYLSN